MPEEPEDDGMVNLGAYESMEAKQLLPKLEAAGVRFEIELDESELMRPFRGVQLAIGIQPPGSKILVFVKEEDLPRAREIAGEP